MLGVNPSRRRSNGVPSPPSDEIRRPCETEFARFEFAEQAFDLRRVLPAVVKAQHVLAEMRIAPEHFHPSLRR
jgi:hypothetical protein